MSKGVQSGFIVIFLDVFLGFAGQFVAGGRCYHHVNETSFFFSLF